MNSLQFTGNLGQDAEQRNLPDGTAVLTMSVPCKSGFGDRAVTTWLRCTLFGKRGESVAPYLKKGALVGISGEFSAREYTDKDGNKRQSLEVRVNDVTLLGGRNEAASTPRPAPKAAPAPANSSGFEDMDDSDIPFVNPLRGAARCLAM